MRRWILFLTFVLGVLAVGGGCVPSTHSPTVTFIQQVFPDDSEATATALGSAGLYSISGYCQPVPEPSMPSCPSRCSNSWFTANAAAGQVDLKLYLQSQAPTPVGGGTPVGGIPSPTPTPTGALQVSLKLLDASGASLGEVNTITPEAPGAITAQVSAAQRVLIDVGCTGADVHFSGTISVP